MDGGPPCRNEGATLNPEACHQWLPPEELTRTAAVFCDPALRLRSLSSCACGMVRSAGPGWGLARQPKKRSSQATEGLITDPSWGHQWKLCNSQRTHMQDRLLGWFICFTDDYFDYVSVSFISGCNCKKKDPSLSSCSPLRS